MKVKNKCIVTGSSSGIGRAIARRLRQEGYSVLGIQRRPPGLSADLRLIKNIPAIWEKACKKSNSIPTLVILAAGMPLEEAFIKTSAKSIQDVMLINLISPLLLAQEILKTWVEARVVGHLIFVGSQAALPGAKQVGNVTYSASKGGIHASVGPLANEYGPLIRVNAIAPGDVITETENKLIRREAYKHGITFTKAIRELDRSSALHRRVRAEEVAEAVIFLDRCLAMTGSIINISAGKSVH